MNEIPRRCVVSMLASTALGVAAGRAGPSALGVRVVVDNFSPRMMPEGFVGLSYESTQLYDRNFFSPGNIDLVRCFRDLGSSGFLRLGGNLSDRSNWRSRSGAFETPKSTAAQIAGKAAWEWKLTNARARADRDGAITPDALETLRGFLDKTGWRAIYGLNFGAGDIARAVDEASHVARLLGPRLMAFQIGNEADFYGGNPMFRGPGYDFARYIDELKTVWRAIKKPAPNARLGGPDTAISMKWVEQFADAMGTEAAFVSSHYYAMGPASDPAMTASRLLGPSPKLDAQIASARAVVARAKLPFLLTEANSCFGGGKSGVSDGFVSALWAVDFLLLTASAGYAGVALHGGGDGIYTPIETLGERAVRRPIYHGAQLAGSLAGWELLACTVSGNGSISAYAGRKENARRLVVVNKSAEPVYPDIVWADVAKRRAAGIVMISSSSPQPIRRMSTGRGRPIDAVPAFAAVSITWD